MIKIFSFIKTHQNTVIPSARIARFMSDITGAPIVCDESIGADQLDALIIVGGAYAFAGKSILEQLGAAIRTAGRLMWVQNDFTVIPPKDESNAESPFRRAFVERREAGLPTTDFWTTVQPMSRPGMSLSGHRVGDRSIYLNWNALTMERFVPIPVASRTFGDQLVYYGSMREKRTKYFDRFFAMPSVPTTISCPTPKFQDRYKSEMITHDTRWTDLYAMLAHFGAGLYLEDTQSHKEFHSPANRFYEMLSVGVPMLFQSEAMKMMERAGYEISDHVVWDRDDLAAKFEKRAEIADAQREMWLDKAIAERDALHDRVAEAWRSYL